MTQKNNRAEEEKALQKIRTDFLHFVVAMDPTFKVNRHAVFICKQINRLVFGDLKRLIISMPPRHGKSLLCSVYLPAFIYGILPQSEVIATSYGHTLAQEFGAKVRAIINSEAYQRIFPDTKIEGEGRSGSTWKTVPVEDEIRQGIYKATGAMGPLTGFGANFIIIDDIFKNSKEASSLTIRNGLKDWFDSTCYSRLLPGGKVLFLMTRWHEDDLIQYVLDNDSEDEWEYYNLEAICSNKEEDPIGREVGEALWPEWYDVDYFNAIKNRNPKQFYSLYQGKPSQGGGGDISQGLIHTWSATSLQEQNTPLPIFVRKYVSWDTASKQGESNDYSVGTVWGETRDKELYLLYVFRDKIPLPELYDTILFLHKSWGCNYTLIEDASSGIGLIQLIHKQHPQLRRRVIGIPAGTKKKLSLIEPIMEQGSVLLLEDDESGEPIIQEMSAFPNATHDDCVSSVVQMVWWWIKEGFAPAIRNTFGIGFPSEKSQSFFRKLREPADRRSSRRRR